MKVENVRIYDLEESLIASGYPMRTMATQNQGLDEKDLKRGHNLSKACDRGNGAHGQYLTGIRVNFDLTFTNKAWVEAERYRFLEFVSSQSTMHRITKFDLREQYNEYVDPRIIDIMEEKVKKYNELAKTVDQNYDQDITDAILDYGNQIEAFKILSKYLLSIDEEDIKEFEEIQSNINKHSEIFSDNSLQEDYEIIRTLQDS